MIRSPLQPSFWPKSAWTSSHEIDRLLHRFLLEIHLEVISQSLAGKDLDGRFMDRSQNPLRLRIDRYSLFKALYSFGSHFTETPKIFEGGDSLYGVSHLEAILEKASRNLRRTTTGQRSYRPFLSVEDSYALLWHTFRNECLICRRLHFIGFHRAISSCRRLSPCLWAIIEGVVGVLSYFFGFLFMDPFCVEGGFVCDVQRVIKWAL